MVEEAKDPGLAVRYARSTSIGWIRIIIVRGVQIFYIFLIARWLLPNEMGYLQIFALGLSFLGSVITPWIGWVLQQKGLSEKDPQEGDKIIHQWTGYGIVIGIVISPITAILYLLTTPVPIWSLDAIIFIVTVLVLSIYQLFNWIYQAHLKIELSLVFGALQTILNFILPLLFFFFTLNITSIFWGWLIADFLVLLLMLPKSGLRASLSAYAVGWPSKVMIIFATPVFFIFLLRALRSFIDRYIILLFFSLADLANYHLVTRITGIASEAILILLIPFLPIMTKVFETRTSKANIALGAALKFLSIAVFFVAPILAFAGLPIIGLILGDQYALPENQLLLAIATMTMVIFAYTSFMGKVRGAKGDTYKLLWFQMSYIAGFSIFIVLFFLIGWVQFLGTFGVALSMTLGYFLAFCLILWFTPEMKLIGKKAAIQLTSLGLVQTIIVYVLALWFAPVDLIECLIITGISFLTLLLFAALFSTFTEDEMNLVSRVSKGRLDPLIKIFKRIGIWEPKQNQPPRGAA